MLPITTIIICLIQITEFLLFRSKIKRGLIIKVGTDKLSIVNKAFGVVGGLGFILVGYFFLDSEFAYKGFNGTMFLGLFFFILGLTDTSNFSFAYHDSIGRTS
jgi:hypothetical protein